MNQKNILHLILKKKWYDMILSGEKKEEYRELKQYWMKRLAAWQDYSNGDLEVHYQPHYIHFTNGYGKHKPNFTIECKGIILGPGKPYWGGADYQFVLKLGDVVKSV